MWAEILSGAFGGASRGLGQVQDMRQQQFSRDQDAIRTQLAQKQQEQAMAEQKRRAVMEAYEKINGGQKLEVTEAQPYVDLGIKFDKDPVSGQLIKPKTPQQQLIDRQLDNLGIEYEQNQIKLHALQEVGEEDFYTRPIEQRQGPAGIAGVPSQLPAEATANSAQLAVAQARAFASNQPRQSAAPTIDDLRRVAFQNVKTRFDTTNPNEWKKPTAQEFDMAVQQEMQQLMQQHGQGTTTVSPTGPPPGTRRVINGTPAVWDGQGWKAAP